MIVKLEGNQISIPTEILEELEFAEGDQLHLTVLDGVLHISSSAAQNTATARTPDQEMAHYIADSFTKLEEMVALLAAVCDAKGRARKAGPERAGEIAQQLEAIVLRAQEAEEK